MTGRPPTPPSGIRPASRSMTTTGRSSTCSPAWLSKRRGWHIKSLPWKGACCANEKMPYSESSAVYPAGGAVAGERNGVELDAFVGMVLLVGIGYGLLALIPASIASRKGRSFGLWWLYGFVFLLLAVIHALLADDAGRIACPHCAEKIQPRASICPHCRSSIEQGDAELLPTPSDESSLPLQQATTLDDMAVLRCVAQADGDLAAASDQLGADISEPIGRLIADGHLAAEDWDRVHVPAETHALLDSLDVPEPEVGSTVDAAGHGEGTQFPSDGTGVLGNRTSWIGSQAAYWNDTSFVLGDSRERIDLTQVQSVYVDSGIADAWLSFVNADASSTTVHVPKVALDDARRLAVELNSTLPQREAYGSQDLQSKGY